MTDVVLLCDDLVASSHDVTECAAVDNAPDPFDLASLRISTDLSEIGVKKIVTVMSCRKPGRQEFVRTRSGDGWTLNTLILEEKETKEHYLVSGMELQDYVLHDMQEGFEAQLRAAVTRAGEVFLWALKLSSSDGRANHWNESALAAAKHAETNWGKVASNMQAARYDVSVATGINIEPKWSELSLQEMIRICFKERIITTPDHPLLRKLRGEV